MRPVAYEAKKVPKIDFRIFGFPRAAVEQDEDDRIRLIRRQVHQVKNHRNKDALTVDLQSNRACNTFSEESKQMIHNLGNVVCFEFCEISHQNPVFILCKKYWTEASCTVLVGHFFCWWHAVLRWSCMHCE